MICDKKLKKDNLRLKVSNLLTHIDKINLQTQRHLEKLRDYWIELCWLFKPTAYVHLFLPPQVVPQIKGYHHRNLFFSTKRKRVATTIRLAKPTHQESRKMVMSGTQVHNIDGESLSQDTQGEHYNGICDST